MRETEAISEQPEGWNVETDFGARRWGAKKALELLEGGHVDAARQILAGAARDWIMPDAPAVEVEPMEIQPWEQRWTVESADRVEGFSRGASGTPARVRLCDKRGRALTLTQGSLPGMYRLAEEIVNLINESVGTSFAVRLDRVGRERRGS